MPATAEAAEQPIIRKALERFKVAAEADKDQRKLEIEDLRFVDDPNGQWLPEHRALRLAGSVAGVPVAARPCLTINLVKPAVRQVANEARNARLAIQINPKGDGASQKTAEIIKGLYRNIEVESRANMARNRALERALKCGRGYYRILKTYANDGDDDLDLIIEPILNQHCVYLDPFHQKPDGSDARYAFIVEDMSLERYKEAYGESALAEMDNEALTGIGDDAPGWIGGDESARVVRVAEYFEVTVTEKPAKNSQRKRTYEVRSITWRKINAVEVLEKEEWEGRYIPIVQVIGEEANIEGKRSYAGLVRDAKDSNRVYNVMASHELESIGLTSKAPWIIAEGQTENYQAIWNEAHLKSFAYLPYTPKTFGGELAPPPQRNVAEPAIQAVSLARRQAKEDAQTVTNTYDPSLGKGESGDSGRKVLALQRQGQHGNSHYLQDFADIAMTHEANIIIDLMPYVYDRDGRIVKILTGDDDTARSVMLNAPFVNGPDGEPQPVETGTAGAQHFDLRKGRYSCTATVGKSFTTQNEEADAMLTEIAAAAPTMVPFFADLWVRAKDIPYGNEIADRLKAMLPPQVQQAMAAKDGQGPQQDPAALQQQIAQLTMQLQQAQQMAQEAQSGIAKAQIDAESREKIKGAELDSKERIAKMEADLAAMKIQIEASVKQQQAQADLAKEALRQNAENRRLAAEQEHAAATQAVDFDHADRQASEQQAHEHATRVADVGHEAGTHATDLSHQADQSHADRTHQAQIAKTKAAQPKGPK